MLRFCIVFLALSLVAALSFLTFPCRPKDHAFYEELLQSSNPLQNDSFLTCSQQKRLNVCKLVWYQGKTPLHIRIESPESELFFIQEDHDIQLTEKLRSVACTMQEELYYVEGKPMQKVCYLEAERANYHYHSNLFVAEDVKLWKFEVEGHAPPEALDNLFPLMSAAAQQVEFTLKGEKRDFIAHHMHAMLNTKERSSGEVYADRARVDYREINGSLEAVKVTLCDNVRLINKGTHEKPASQYALADVVYYSPPEQFMILEGKQNRVLFYDTMRDTQLSARIVHAQRDIATKKECVQGIGDVRFVFGSEELDKIKTRFQVK